MASRLKQLGYSNVTLLERTHRVGGKSFTIYRDANGQDCEQTSTCNVDTKNCTVDTESCTAFEMGTCFLHNGYHTIRDLVREYKLTPEVAPEGRAMFSHHAKDKFSSQDMGDFVTSSIMELVNSGVVKRTWILSQLAKSDTLTVMDALTSAVKKYNILHSRIFGKLVFSFPEKPNEENLKLINMTFAEFLDSNGLQALESFLAFAQAAQGYGYVKSIPAFYGLWWITPELLNGYIQMSMHEKIEEYKAMACLSNTSLTRAVVKKLTTCMVGGEADTVFRTTTMLPEGYGKLWKTIYEQDELDVKFGVEIKTGGIDRQLARRDAGVKVTYRQDGGEWRTEEYDFLLYTAPFAHSHKFVNDLTKQERSIFSQLESFVLTTTLYQSDAVKDYSEPDLDSPIMYNVDKLDSYTHDGGWYADRDDPRIFGDYRYDRGQTRVGYQFFEKYCDFDDALCDTDRTPDDQKSPRFDEAPEVKNKFQQELKDQNVENVRILEQFPWPYFHHFPQDSINKGKPWEIIEMQGSQKTWWLGASASFESVHDVTNYNLMILQKYLPQSRA